MELISDDKSLYRVVGWYKQGPNLKALHLEVNGVSREYNRRVSDICICPDLCLR